MAEVRLGLGRGAYNISINAYSRSFLAVRSTRRGSATYAPSLSTGSRLDLVQNSLSITAIVHRRAPSQGYCETESSLFPRSVVVGDSDLYHELAQRETLLLQLQSTWGCCDDDTRTAQKSHFSRGQKTSDSPVGRASSISRCTTPHVLYHLTRRPEILLSRHHVLGHHRQQLVFMRHFSGNEDEPLYKTKTGYYDILEVSPDATHAQIKTAYYKLSFVYHPDKNAGSEDATLRFSDISEAYNVLGNKTLRKKYDRGILSQSDLVTRPSSIGAGGSAKQPTRSQQSVIDIDGKNVFDFDKYIKSHYKAQIQQGKDTKLRRDEMLRKRTETVVDWKLDKMMELGVGMMVAVAIAIIFSIKRSG